MRRRKGKRPTSGNPHHKAKAASRLSKGLPRLANANRRRRKSELEIVALMHEQREVISDSFLSTKPHSQQ